MESAHLITKGEACITSYISTVLCSRCDLTAVGIRSMRFNALYVYEWAAVKDRALNLTVVGSCYEVVVWLCPSFGFSDSPSGLSVRLFWRPVLADRSSGIGMASSWSSPPSLAVGLSLPEQRVEKLPKWTQTRWVSTTTNAVETSLLR